MAVSSEDEGRVNPNRSSRQRSRAVSATQSEGDDESSGCMCTKCCRKNLLLILTLSSVVLGLITGYLLKDAELTPVTLRFIALPGEILMSLFKGIVVPLIVVSIVAGIANMDAASMGRLNGLAFLYYTLTTVVAVLIGTGLVLVIHPGNPDLKVHTDGGSLKLPAPSQLHAVIYDLIINLFPDNLFSATFQSRKTIIDYVPLSHPSNTTHHPTLDAASSIDKLSQAMNLTKSVLLAVNGSKSFDEDFASLNRSLHDLVQAEHEAIHRLEMKIDKDGGGGEKKERYVLVNRDGSNVLGLLVYSFAFGIIISYAKEKGKYIRDLFTALDYLIGRFVLLIIWYSPIGIFSLLLTQMLINPDFLGIVKSLGIFIGTVLSGLFIHLFLVLFPLYIVFVKKNPLKLMRGVADMLAVAFGTASSVAALPLHFKCLQENMGISREVCQMVLPVACTINMNGTALYEAVASIFIAQLNGITLTFVDCVIVVFMSSIAALGAAAIPSAGLFTMVMILSAINVPIEDISLIMSIDWMIDRIRTPINCLGDTFGACIIDVYGKKRGLIEDAAHTSALRSSNSEDEENSVE